MSADESTPDRGRWAGLRADFLDVDTRWLALLRIVMGLSLFVYVIVVASQDRVTAFFSDQGMLTLDVLARHAPGHYATTIFRFAHTAGEAKVLLAVEAMLALSVACGIGTRVTAPLALLGLISIHHRIVFVVNASMVTMHLIALPWVFLPLGRHASVDAWLARRRGLVRAPMRLRTLAPLVLRLQLFVIYYFNAVHKSGATWRGGEAVHYVLYSSRSAWPWTVWLRAHEPAWFSPLMTYSALALELGLAIVLVFPAARPRCIRLAALGMALLHGGILAMVALLPFPFVFAVAALMLFASEDGSKLDRLLGTSGPCTTESRLGGAGLGGRAREAFLALHLLLGVYLNWAGNHGMRLVLGPPPVVEPAHRVADALFIHQAWSMFAPEAPQLDVVLEPAVELADGRVLDANTRRPPSFEGLDARFVEIDFFLYLFESKLVDLNDPAAYDAYVRYQAARPRREGWGGDERVREVTVHRFKMRRPPRGASQPAFTSTEVVWAKRFLPTEEPGRSYL